MLFGREILGLPVFAMDQKLLGTVKSYELDNSGVLSALIITTAGLVARDYRIPARQIATASLKGVYLHKAARLQKAPKHNASAAFIGRAVYDGEGRYLGNISDIMVENAQICAVELSRGLYDDLCSGRPTVSFSGLQPFENGFICR